MPPRAAIYCRISKDAEGEGLGVARQETDCRALVERKGWILHDVYVDNDLSAFSGKARPRYSAMLDAVRAGEVDAIVAWHPDRLHRSPLELEHFIELLEGSRATVATVTAGDVDLATPDGRLMARIVGSVARKESEDKSRRLRRKHQELAERGMLAGGGRRPFGYEADRVTVRPSEARLIEEAVERVIEGDSVRSIVKWWTDAGVPTSTGAQWSPTTVRRLLMSARIAGFRSHHDQITGPAVWPAIITREQHERLRAILSDPKRNRAAGVTPRSYLLSGFVRCGGCGAKMTAAPTGRGKRRYHCMRDRGGCNRVGIAADQLEDIVVSAALKRLNTPTGRRAVMEQRPGLDHLAEVADLESRLEELASDFYENRLIGRGEFLAARKGLRERLDGARAAVAQESRSTVLGAYSGAPEVVRERWEAATLDQRRALLAQIIDAVVIAPTTRANNRFDPDRVTVEWSG